LSGSLPVSSFPRLKDIVVGNDGEIAYEVEGIRDERDRPMLGLHATGTLTLQCQRCLGALEFPLRVASSVLVVPAGETPDDADDPESPDYIEAQRELDLAQLIEDEILLALPYAPRHESACAAAPVVAGSEPAKKSPFAALAALKNTTKT
jgi:uncharacterized protein